MSLPRFELEAWFAGAEGRYDYSLSNSDCQPLRVADLFEDGVPEAFTATDLAYGAFDGLAELRRLVADQYETVDPDDALILNGPSEAIYTFMRASLKPGDEVVVPTPLFHTLHAIARDIGCSLKQWRPRDEKSCSFDVSALAELCGDATKLIVLNFPHNPSGRLISESDLRRTVEIAESVDALLFSDETFRLLEIPPNRTLPAACDLYGKAISVSGVSKAFGLGGLRVGWLVTKSTPIREAVKQYRFHTTEMTNTPCQLLAARALERQERILGRNRARIAENLDRLRRFVDEHDRMLSLHAPMAGTMALVEQRTPLASTQLCERLLDEERLFLVPGKPLGMSDRLLRFGLGRDDLGAGLEGLAGFLRRL